MSLLTVREKLSLTVREMLSLEGKSLIKSSPLGTWKIFISFWKIRCFWRDLGELRRSAKEIFKIVR